MHSTFILMRTLTNLLVVPLILIGQSGFVSSPNVGKTPAEKALSKDFAFITGGVITLSEAVQFVDGFYMARVEVSNLNYRNFLNSLKQSGDLEGYTTSLWDTAGWRVGMSFNEPFVQYYHSHPAYNDYPAVNIPFEGAVRYCLWLQQELLARMPLSKFSFHVGLPSKEQWIRAAEGNHQGAIYSWGHYRLFEPKRGVLCNHLQWGDECIYRDPETGEISVIRSCGDPMGVASYLSDNASITAPVKSYYPSAIGLYNMNGNVAEMLNCGTLAMGGSWLSPGYDVRNRSEMIFKGPSADIGFRPVVFVGSPGGR